MENNLPRQIVPFDNPELVVLRNPVARAKFGLSLVQSKILFEIIAYLKTRPTENFMTINVGDLLNKIGVETKRVKYYVEEIEEMTKKHLRIPEGDNEEGINYLAVNLLAGARFRIDKDGRGSIDIEISSMLKPYYLEIAKGDFFSYHILNTRVLKSTYSVKLYLLLKSYKRFGKLEIGLDELKNILELSPTDYKQFPDFKKRVLERARTEIQEKNDIFFTYDEVRQFPRNSKSPVVRIVFYIKDNPDQKVRMARLVEEKRAKRAPAVILDEDGNEIKTKLGGKVATTRTNLGEGGAGIQTYLGGKEPAEKSAKTPPNKAALTDLAAGLSENQSENRVGEGDSPVFNENIKTDLGGNRKEAPTNLGGGFGDSLLDERQREILRLFRFFDKTASETFILDYVNGVGQDMEAILDALIYAQRQGTVKNIYAYLPTILRGKAGHGLAEKNRQRARKTVAEAEKATKLAGLKIQVEDIFEEAEAIKRDIVRGIVAADGQATELVIGQVKRKFSGSFGITDEVAMDEFRERPLLRSLVMHEFRVQFPGEFDHNPDLLELEKKLSALKTQAKKLDPGFSA